MCRCELDRNVRDAHIDARGRDRCTEESVTVLCRYEVSQDFHNTCMNREDRKRN